MIDITDFDVQSWVIVPIANQSAAPPPPDRQNYLMTLTGVANLNFKRGALLNGQTGWQDQTFRLLLDWQSPVYATRGNPSAGNRPYFVAEQWAPYANFNSVLSSQDGDTIAGFALNNWRMNFVEMRSSAGVIYKNVVKGLEIDASVLDSTLIAEIFRVGFQVTLLGKIVSIIS